MLSKFRGLRNRPNEEQGFTLVELMITVVILGILAAIAIPIFINQQKASVEAGMKQDLRSIALAQHIYMSKNIHDSGTSDAVILNELVPKMSDENTKMNVWVVDGVGFCAVTSNPLTTVNGGDWENGRYFWYDSALGGMPHGEVTGNPPVGGACEVTPRPANARWDVPDQEWKN